jgi:hypothetical protein
MRIIALAAVIIAASAQAVSSANALTVTPLLQPTAPVYSNLTSCASIGFNPDGSIYGACQYRQGNCGRYCSPAELRYAVLWASDGSRPAVIAACGSSTAGLAGRQVTTYLAPYTAATCHVNFDPTGTTVGIPYGQYAWQVTYYYYVTTYTNGNELANSSGQSFLVTP